jgi:hypothetical protein
MQNEHRDPIDDRRTRPEYCALSTIEYYLGVASCYPQTVNHVVADRQLALPLEKKVALVVIAKPQGSVNFQ